jgi:hypothetical protein
MTDSSRYSEDMKAIRKIMEDSTRFLSLSGLSGIFAGIIALTGAAVAWFIILKTVNILNYEYFNSLPAKETGIIKSQLVIDGLIILILAVVFSLYFSLKKARRDGKKIWTPVSRKLLINLLVPLIAGGMFVLVLLIQNQLQLIIPSLLLFYGLALVNAGKFTYGEVFYLGLSEVITGIISGFFSEYGIVFWCFGFGILHIVYGILMIRKYER